MSTPTTCQCGHSLDEHSFIGRCARDSGVTASDVEPHETTTLAVAHGHRADDCYECLCFVFVPVAWRV